MVKFRMFIGLLVSVVIAGSLGCKMGVYPNSKLLASQKYVKTAGAVIVDARSKAAYDAGHIPGAISMVWQDFSKFTSDPETNATLKDVPDLEADLSALGLTRDTRIVIYDDTTASWGAAGRIFWMLEYLGCTQVRILNGGWDKWVADGNDTETTENTLTPTTFTALENSDVDVNKAYIASRLGDDDFVVVDSRTDEEYNGWTLYGETRGGHISGAVQMPYEGFFNEDKTILTSSELRSLFRDHGLSKDKEVVSYCTAGIRSGFIYFLTRLMGYPRTANYDASMWDWSAADPSSYPMEELTNYDELVYPEWVKQLIDYHAAGSSSDPPNGYAYARDHKYLIFETQWGSFDDMAQGWADDSYLQGHIPGAIHSNSDVYENGYPRWFLLPETELKAALGQMGITADTTVVVYSNSPIFAARLWWILRYAGVVDVRFLNGGYDAWVKAGYAEETTINEPVAVTYDGTLRPELIAATDYVEANYNTGDTILADVRTYREYLGKTSGYSYVVNKGRIPGAIYAYNADTPDTEYLDEDGTLRAYTDVLDMWSELGIQSTAVSTEFDKEVIFYCGSGYRSSLAYLYAYLAGYENARNYSDGWEGWSTTYIEDPSHVADPNVPGDTDGWIQDPSGRPVESGRP